jgi:BlaI family transcriptional regulator, penicillinase repressor
MAKKALPALSAAEQALMDILWKKHPASVLELLDAVNENRREPVTRNTLQTQLTRLEAKGWIVRDDSSRSHSYEPAVKEQHGRTSVLAELKKRFFGASSLALVRCLVENGDITAEELAELKKLISSKKGGTSS